MKKFGEHKAVIIFLATMGVLALPLLSVALRDLRFRPPVPFSFDFFGFFAASAVKACSASLYLRALKRAWPVFYGAYFRQCNELYRSKS